MRRLAGVWLLLSSLALAEAPDGGVDRRLFDVSDAAAVKKAEAAMQTAGSGLREFLPPS